MLPSVICYVCGSAGANSPIHIYPRDKGSYFPFLETHDPPKGARNPGPDGTVDACQVCYAFLNQQWESYERSKTPAIKRLYWLKRTDNGAFTGAEMRVQGEYVAQMMWLENPPGGKSGQQGYTARSFDFRQHMPSSGECHMPSSPSLAASISPVSSGLQNLSNSSPDNRELHRMDSSGALDLSSSAGKGKSPGEKPRIKKDSRDRDDKMTMGKQWRVYESNRVPESQRTYNIGGHPIIELNAAGYRSQHGSNDLVNMSRSSGSKSSSLEEVCYLCAQVYSRSSMRLLYTSPPVENSKHSMYFPFVQSMKRPSGAKPMDSEQRVLCCRACYSYLQRQWQFYQNEKVPISKRHFMLRPVSELSQDGSVENSLPASSSKLAENMTHSVKTETATSSPAEPLNIVISSSTRDRRSTTSSCRSVSAGSSQSGLLAIASPPQFTVPLPVMSLSTVTPAVSGVLPGGVSLPGLAPGLSLPATMAMYPPPFMFPGCEMFPDYPYQINNTELSQQRSLADKLTIKKELTDDVHSVNKDSLMQLTFNKLEYDILTANIIYVSFRAGG
ncbi:hypothetical protein LSH36_418g02024 [Paralvinella palmiformis]|uniref:Uncharacterized protein n=1 Tax=Paralvinella palmiformis TaxID=53620 RepID=A0AAD9MZT3_9ANNE|nr:hypothetical protein LSH36_418g02024 [Paralvinella palmiformis]